jgi:hypothetical protein
MKHFLVTVRTPGKVHQFYAPAYSAASAYDLAAAKQGDDVFGITVLPA